MDKFLSIAISTYEMSGRGVEFLSFSFNKLYLQIFKDFEIVISDNSKNDDIKKLCDDWYDRLNIKYFKNDPNKSDLPSSNINNALQKCKGDYIKILFQDDFLNSNQSLYLLNKHITNNPDVIWLAHGCNHSHDGIYLHSKHLPKWNEDIFLGKNTIGSPSTICIKNFDIPLFDENLKWMMDCDWYEKLNIKYGNPSILMDDIVTIRLWESQLTNTLTNEYKIQEHILIHDRYKNKSSMI
jgi:hypothetical protein